MNDREIIRALKAIADPTRFRMIQEIAAAGEMSCGELGEHFDLSQPTISHHLKLLCDARVLVGRAEGKHRYTSVNHALLGDLSSFLPARLAPLARHRRRPERTRTRA